MIPEQQNRIEEALARVREDLRKLPDYTLTETELDRRVVEWLENEARGLRMFTSIWAHRGKR